MDYYSLKSIVSSQKKQIPADEKSQSFFTITEKNPTYVEPKFSKVERFPVEKPAVILVSAVGASGKTTAALSLSADTGMPILDLAEHKPVGDNTLSGILMDYYPNTISEIRNGLANGTSGIIIDGIDEGRSKVTEEAFEAFLDDVIKRTEGATSTSIVILGRSQTLINTWCYLIDNGVDVGLVQIDPFEMDQAKKYIDIHVNKIPPSHRPAYEKARDQILKTLGAAFNVAEGTDGSYIKFLGYPPVLDAISTLLNEESNHHYLSQKLDRGADNSTEVSLLLEIGDYLLHREQQDKAYPNFLVEFIEKVDVSHGDSHGHNLYNDEEQCARVLGAALGTPVPCNFIPDLGLNLEYEKSVARWCPEHPFLDDSKLRNPVFEAIAIAKCFTSEVEEYQSLAMDYVKRHEQSYHVLYILDEISGDRNVPIGAFNMLIQSCSDFLGGQNDVAVDIDGLSWDDLDETNETTVWLEISVSKDGKGRTFKFVAKAPVDETIKIGPNLINSRITLPCHVGLTGRVNINTFDDCYLSARSVDFSAPEILISRTKSSAQEAIASGSFVVETESAMGHVDAIAPKEGTMEILCMEHGLAYPLVKCTRVIERPQNADIREKYRRLRKIITLFRSHSKGCLARFKDKIQHARVLRNDEGRAVLDALIDSGVVFLKGKMYYIDSGKFSEELGIDWMALRGYERSDRLERFLENIQ